MDILRKFKDCRQKACYFIEYKFIMNNRNPKINRAKFTQNGSGIFKFEVKVSATAESDLKFKPIED